MEKGENESDAKTILVKKKCKKIELKINGFYIDEDESVSFEDAYLLVNDVKISFKIYEANGDCLTKLHLIIESDKEVYLVDKRVPGISKTL